MALEVAVPFTVLAICDWVKAEPHVGCNGIDDIGSEPWPGALSGVFTVNQQGDKVCFSQGNLQYHASNRKWRFAKHQYDALREANSNISASYDGWIDLFGWGTSGIWSYSPRAFCYQPWCSEISHNYYYNAYGSYNTDLCSEGGQADWGYNAISNGGNLANSGWRSLTEDEWRYLLNERRTTSDEVRYAKAVVNGVCGLIVVPDGWSIANGLVLRHGNEPQASYASNLITVKDWTNAWERKGCVFLPTGGYRKGNDVIGADAAGHYWSATHGSSRTASMVYFSANSTIAAINYLRGYGASVRLVRDAN